MLGLQGSPSAMGIALDDLMKDAVECDFHQLAFADVNVAMWKAVVTQIVGCILKRCTNIKQYVEVSIDLLFGKNGLGNFELSEKFIGTGYMKQWYFYPNRGVCIVPEYIILLVEHIIDEVLEGVTIAK